MKREIIIDGKASDWFEKATFILKESKQEVIPQDLLHYAEDIIENYMKKVPRDRSNTKKEVTNVQSAEPFATMAIEAYRKMKDDYEYIKKEKETLRKRAKHVNTFVILAIIACLLSIAALVLSHI